MIKIQMNINEKELGSKDTELENLESNSSVARDCISIDTTTTSLANESDVSNPDVVIHEASSLSNDAVPITNKVNPLCSDYFLQAVPDNQRELCQYKIDDIELMEIQRRRLSYISDNERKDQIFSANHKQAFHSLAKQEHAFSGAMAGVCVSCCLHPVDTIKTVIQSCHASKKGTHGDEKHTKLITISRRLRMLLNNRNMGVGKDGLSNPVGG
ncbi:hypothetical protein KIW84_030406 [Lathyrus oleraceus]|uniref:Uncharacterized protein n=1 Tax=Pisum sativum TaxID=3888 RepID=A0A9D4XQA7_PEA|nr:hypothetical protein KIW84_030406 [Pisum sativum]